MMRLFNTVSLACVLCLAPTAAFAQDQTPESLACLESSYSAKQNARISEMLPTMTLEDKAQSEEMAVIIASVAGKCGPQYGWSEAQTFNAIIFELSRLQEFRFRNFGPFSAEELARFDAALASKDRSELWSVIEAQTAEAAGLIPKAFEDEAGYQAAYTVMGKFAFEVDLATGSQPVHLGELLGFMALQRMALREFAD